MYCCLDPRLDIGGVRDAARAGGRGRGRRRHPAPHRQAEGNVSTHYTTLHCQRQRHHGSSDPCSSPAIQRDARAGRSVHFG